MAINAYLKVDDVNEVCDFIGAMIYSYDNKTIDVDLLSEKIMRDTCIPNRIEINKLGHIIDSFDVDHVTVLLVIEKALNLFYVEVI